MVRFLAYSSVWKVVVLYHRIVVVVDTLHVFEIKIFVKDCSVLLNLHSFEIALYCL